MSLILLPDGTPAADAARSVRETAIEMIRAMTGDTTTPPEVLASPERAEATIRAARGRVPTWAANRTGRPVIRLG